MGLFANFKKRVLAFLDSRIAGTNEERSKKNLDVILVGISTLSIPAFFIYLVFSLFIEVTVAEMQLLTLSFALFLITMTIIYFLNRRTEGNLASHLFLVFFYFFIVISETVFEVTRGRGLVLFAIPIMLSGMLLPPWTSFLASIVSAAIVSWLAVTSNQVPDIGAISSFILLGTISWILSRNQNEVIERINSVNIVLDKMVENRTRELIKANERLQNLSDMKTRFVSTATHELRTPLTSMKGYLELVLNESHSPTVTEYLEIVEKNIKRLEALTDDLLNQQRIEQGRMELIKESIIFQTLILEVVEEVKGLIGDSSRSLVLHLPEKEIIIHGDKLRLHQVNTNLLDNALKYSPQDSEVTIEVMEIDEYIQVSIKDQGIGLRPEDMEELFKPFPNIDRPVTTHQSVGLGLSISKGLIEMHGGEIWATSDGKGKGATFTYKLPVKQPTQVAQ